MINLNKIAVLLLLSFTTQTVFAADLIEFQANTPALASEVNANFSALNDDTQANETAITANSSAIGDNTTAINTNAANITSNTTDIATNTASIGSNASDISSNSTNIIANTSDIATNASNIASNLGAIGVNASGISGNASSITSALASIDANSANITQNISDIADLVAQIGAITTSPPSPQQAPQFLGVDCDAGGSLQDVINSAQPGFAIVIGVGTCAENIFMERDGIQIWGHADGLTITGDGSGSSSVITVDGVHNYRLRNLTVTATDQNAIQIGDFSAGVVEDLTVVASSSAGSVTALNLGSSGRAIISRSSFSANSDSANATGVSVANSGIFFSLGEVEVTATANNGNARAISNSGNGIAGIFGVFGNTTLSADGQGLTNETSLALFQNSGAAFYIINAAGQSVNLVGDILINDSTAAFVQANVAGLDLVSNRSSLLFSGNENVFTGQGDIFKVNATGGDVAIINAGTLDFNIDIDTGSSLFTSGTTFTGEIQIANTSAIETVADTVISGDFAVALNSSALLRENTQVNALDLVFGGRAALNDTATIGTVTQTETYTCMLLIQDAAAVTTAPSECP